VEGIGRWMLARKNRKNKKKDEPRNADGGRDATFCGNPFENAPRLNDTHTIPVRAPRGACCRNGDKIGYAAHRERVGSFVEAAPT